MEHDKFLIELIAKNYNLEESVVMQNREIPQRVAAERFLSPESKKKLEGIGYFLPLDKNSRQRRLAFTLNSPLPEFKDDFYQTPEGKLWYDCNVVHGQVYLDICARAYSGAQRFARNIAEGQARTRAKTSGFKFKAVG